MKSIRVVYQDVYPLESIERDVEELPDLLESF